MFSLKYQIAQREKLHMIQIPQYSQAEDLWKKTTRKSFINIIYV